MATSPIKVPTYPQYTNLALNEGLFDQLMTTVKYHLDKEYDQQRIRGSEYAKVYLGSLESVMGNTTQYLLGIMLIDEQRAQLRLENEKLQFEIDELLPLLKTKTQSEIDLIESQISKTAQEILFLIQKTKTELANIDGSSVSATSIIGRQMSLLKAQQLGFAGNIETQVTKYHADYDGLFQSVQEIPEQATLSTPANDAIMRALLTADAITNA